MTTESSRTDDSMLAALLRSHIRSQDGTTEQFADRSDISRNTLYRWLTLGQTPSEPKVRLLAPELGLSVEALHILGEVGVVEACQIVVDTKQSEDRALQTRFLEVVRQKGDLLPTAAYIIYLPGDTDDRSRLVDALEQHPDDTQAALASVVLQIMEDRSSPIAPESLPVD